MASIEAMREYVSRQYGDSWRDQVEKMHDNQVIAIYYSILEENDKMRKLPVTRKLRRSEVRGGEQLSLFVNKRSKKIKEEYLK